jgi:2'-5' RNA ligase
MPESETKRLFVAIVPPAHVAKNLGDLAARLAERFPKRTIRWTSPEKIHLTLNFLGAIGAARILSIESALKSACNGHHQNVIRVVGLGCFSNRVRPQIIWAGLTGDLRPLENLKRSIDLHLAALGCIIEERAFQPHATIGRVLNLNSAGRREIAETLDEHMKSDFGEWQIARIDLVQSVLSPAGATYRTLNSVTLES